MVLNVTDSRGPKEHCVGLKSQSPQRRGEGDSLHPLPVFSGHMLHTCPFLQNYNWLYFTHIIAANARGNVSTKGNNLRWQWLPSIRHMLGRKIDVCFGKHGPKKLGSVLFFIQFHSHLCMLYMVLYSGWHQINTHEVCKCFVHIKYTVTILFFGCQHVHRHFVIACTRDVVSRPIVVTSQSQEIEGRSQSRSKSQTPRSHLRLMS